MTNHRPYEAADITPKLLESFDHEGQFMEASADLMKTVLPHLAAASGLVPKDAPGWKGNDAILMGMMVRLLKLSRSLYDQIIEERLEIAWILTRCIYETSVRLRYLIQKNDPSEFDGFLLAGSESEVRLRSDIEKNIQERGGVMLPIEERMLASLQRHRDAGFLEESFRKWRDCRKLGQEIGLGDEAYRGGFQIPSLAVHGFASDLFRLHLEAVDSEHYIPSAEWTRVRPQILTVNTLFLLSTISEYVVYRLGMDDPGSMEWITQLETIEDAVRRLDQSHESFVQNRK